MGYIWSAIVVLAMLNSWRYAIREWQAGNRFGAAAFMAFTVGVAALAIWELLYRW